MRNGSALALLWRRIPLLCLAELVHKSRKVELSRVLWTLLCEHELIYFFDHVEVFVKDLSLVHNGTCNFATHIPGSLSNKSYLHFEHIDVILLMHQEVFQRIWRFFYLCGLRLTLRMIVRRDERGFFNCFLRVMQLALRLPFLNAIEQIYDFLWCLLD
jgi:hypothetical protein